MCLQQKNLGWESLTDSWLLHLDPLLEPFVSELRGLFAWLVPPCLEYLSRHCHMTVPTSDMALVSSLCKMLAALLDELRLVLAKEREREEARRIEEESGQPAAKIEPVRPAGADAVGADGAPVAAAAPVALDDQYTDQPEMRSQWVECMFLFSVVWSLGASTDTEGRALFSAFYRDLLQGRCAADVRSYNAERFASRRPQLPFPSPADYSSTSSSASDCKDVYEYVYNRRAGSGQWVNWMTVEPAYVIPEGAKFHELIVPTVDTVRTNWLLTLLITHRQHVMLSGSTGTGQSLRSTVEVGEAPCRSIDSAAVQCAVPRSPLGSV